MTTYGVYTAAEEVALRAKLTRTLLCFIFSPTRSRTGDI